MPERPSVDDAGSSVSGLRQDEVEDVGFVAELEALGVAEVVAVDLVGERAVPLDRDLVTSVR